MATKTRNIIRWFYPPVLGLVIFNVLRAITDLTRNNAFWTGDMHAHLIAVFFTIAFCYVCDYLWRRKLSGTDKNGSVVREYVRVFLQLFVSLNIALIFGTYIGIFIMGNVAIDYILVNVSSIPLLLLYYTLIRNSVVNQNYQEQLLLIEKLKTEKADTELNYLKAQYHPHFLFNALNTVYFQIDERDRQAKQTVELLSELLRYQLYDASQQVPISKEIEFIRNYIHFQQMRISENLKLHIEVDPQLNDDQRIYPLLFQPLVENAFKYLGEDYRIAISICLTDNSEIQFTVENAVSQQSSSEQQRNSGIGLTNLRRRLDLLYPEAHTLNTELREGIFYARLAIEANSHAN